MKSRTLQNIITTSIQNWRVKHALIFVLAVLLIASCKKPTDNDFRADPFDKDRGAVYIDTFSVKLSTLRAIDSFTTHGATRIMAGNYIDPDMGQTTFRSYFEVAPLNSNERNFGASPRLDSMVLRLSQRYVYGARSTSGQLVLYRLRDPLPEDRNSFFNFEVIPDLVSVAGTTEIGFDSLAMVRINLTELGNEIIRIPETSDVFKSTNSFRHYLKGFSLETSNSTRFVAGYDLSRSNMALYFTDQVNGRRDSINFVLIGNSTRRYNTTTVLPAGLTNTIVNRYDELPSSQTRDKILLQNGNYLRGRIEFPYLKRTLDSYGRVIFSRAEIEITVRENKGYAPPQFLTLYETDTADGRILEISGIRKNVQTDGNPVSGISSPINLIYNPTQKKYVGRVTMHLQAMMFGQRPFGSFVLSTFPVDDGISANRLEILDGDVKLKLYLIKLADPVTD